MNTTTVVKSVQVANTVTGDYDPAKPLPYPYHIEADGKVARQDFWKGEPLRLAGFQHGDVQQVVVHADEWLTGDIDVTGMHPVFIDKGGNMWSHAMPVSK